MIFTSFLIFLVFSTYSQSIIINRLGAISIIFSLVLYVSSINVTVDNLSLYNNWFTLSNYNLPIIITIFLLSIAILIYSTSESRYDLSSPYYLIILIPNLIGLIMLPMVNDLISLYVIIELQSYSLYLLTGLHNRSYNASRASLLYFLMGGVASTIILLSSYFIYNSTGTTNISDIYLINNYIDTKDYFDILLIALMFKMGMAPLHRWSIAVYNYAPTYITAYISIVAKLSIVAWIFNHNILFNNHIFIIFFYVSLFIACYKPLFQINIKVILAYSGMLNFGYILLSIVNNDISFYIYLIQYVLTHVVLFIGLLGASQYVGAPASKWSPLIFINQLKLPNVSLAICFIICLFSLIGIPPLPGFYAKLYVLSNALQDNYILEVLTIVICSVIATYFYANIIKLLIQSKTQVCNEINPSLSYLIALGTTLIVSFFIFLPSLSEGLFLILV